ncbi:MAG: hydrolase Nlp/P60, partial [Hungatella hathewayi]|nr:hydrolase Nlp/P60 [Hungatella hathewayi]
DLICYAGHVAIYIGNGQIVHASTPSTGIKVGTATYRTILSVRRIV